MEPLGLLYSAADSVKRRVKNLLSDPVGYLQQAVDNALPTQYESEQGLLKMRGQAHNPYAAENGDRKVKELAMNFNPASAGITVWHGTPHKFAPTAKNPLGEFDLGKIGTGEGAQAYGHGVYVAESPETARVYQDSLSKPTFIEKKTGRSITPQEQEWQDILDRKFRMESNGYGDKFSKIYDMNAGGNLYKVDLPDEHLSRFLDWDKPLSQQTPEVAASLLDDPAWQFAQSVSGKAGDNGRFVYKDIADRLGGDVAATEYLKSKGILGLRYLDQGSRDSMQGTRNAVVFDPSILNILERQ